MKTRMITLVLSISVSIFFGISGCDTFKKASSKVENALFGDPEYVANPGTNASDFLESASGSSGINLSALSEALSAAESESSEEVLSLQGMFLAEKDSEVSSISTDAINLLKEGEVQKSSFKSGGFSQPDSGFADEPTKAPQYAFIGLNLDGTVVEKSSDYDSKEDSITEASWEGKSEIMIPNLDRVPVRDQSQRGTCASFAGIGALEYLFLKKYGDKVPSIDLSEQRFYMMSKSDLWSTGGTTDVDGGSAWEAGYSMSYGSGGKTPPTDHNPYNIPLELDCPYNGDPGSNELQIPQASTCRRGAVRVTNLTRSYYSSPTGSDPWTLHTSGLREAQEIFNFIKNKGLPVPVGTVLSANWMDNDGMITYAEATAGGGPHAGGHAYLIVGARKLDESKFPNEGGMCFVIKNSWGTGWGVNGYSCMTLAWFNNYRRAYPYDFALDLEWDEAYITEKMAPPSITSEPTPVDEIPEEETPESEPQPEVVVGTDPGAPPEPESIEQAPDYVPPEEPSTTPEGFTVGKLVDKKGQLKSVLFKVDGSSISIKGVYPGLTKTTKPLILGYSDGKLSFDDSLHEKTGVIGGELSGDTLILCSKAYAQVCELNLKSDTNELVIGVTETEFLDYKADESADYTTLFELNNYGIKYYYPGGLHIDFKLILKGSGLVQTTTNPIRLKFKPSTQEIFYRGIPVGSLSNLSLCSGDYRKICRFVVGSNDASMNIFLKAKAQ